MIFCIHLLSFPMHVHDTRHNAWMAGLYDQDALLYMCIAVWRSIYCQQWRAMKKKSNSEWMPTPNCISGHEPLRSNFKKESPSSTGILVLRVYCDHMTLIFLAFLFFDFLWFSFLQPVYYGAVCLLYSVVWSQRVQLRRRKGKEQ